MRARTWGGGRPGLGWTAAPRYTPSTLRAPHTAHVEGHTGHRCSSERTETQTAHLPKLRGLTPQTFPPASQDVSSSRPHPQGTPASWSCPQPPVLSRHLGEAPSFSKHSYWKPGAQLPHQPVGAGLRQGRAPASQHPAPLCAQGPPASPLGFLAQVAMRAGLLPRATGGRWAQAPMEQAQRQGPREGAAGPAGATRWGDTRSGPGEPTSTRHWREDASTRQAPVQGKLGPLLILPSPEPRPPAQAVGPHDSSSAQAAH